MVMSKEKICLIRNSAIKMMGGFCKACGETDIKDLHVHHIIPLKTLKGRGSRARAWEALELAYQGKGLVLCSYCHGMLHSNDKMLWMQAAATMSYEERFRRDLMEDFKGEGYWDVVC